MTEAYDYSAGLNETLAKAHAKVEAFVADPIRREAVTDDRDGKDLRYLLILRAAVFNLAAFALLAAAYLQGWVSEVVGADDTGLTLGIFIVFVAGLAISATKFWKISVELNTVRGPDLDTGSWACSYLTEIASRDAGSRAITASTLRTRVFSRIAIVRQFANSLVLLGLIGTVVGFIISLSGVDPESASDVRSVSPMVAELIRGMSVALYTTLVGAILNLWLMVNYHLLAGGAIKLVTGLVALGEANARH